ncbi:MAG: FAD-dependent oxidoreductase [Patescibacteria group bacterium]
MPYDLIIIGSGAAGLAAGLYAGRYRMKTLIIGEEFGGLTSRAGVIWNYPGNKGIDGYDLMVIMRDQAKEVGTEVKDGTVTSVVNDGGCFTVTTAKGVIYHAKTVLFACGTKHRKLGLPNEDALLGKGLHVCATCDAPLYAGKEVIIVGGGDSSVKSINLAAEYVSKIYFVVRDGITAEPINYEQMQKLGDKVEVLMNNEVAELVGENKFEKVVLKKPHDGHVELAAAGIFVEVGAKPNVEIASMIGVGLDEKGYIKTNALAETNIPGAYAAGDTTNLFGFFKQDITAAAMGAVAATSAYNFTKLHVNLCEPDKKA